MAVFDVIDAGVAPIANHLRHRAARNSAIAANIANIDTPGYKAVDVTFKSALEEAGVRMDRTNPNHLNHSGLSSGGFDVVEIGGDPRRDGNDVNIDHEMVQLAQNQLEYRFLARSLARRFNKLREAITGRAQ